ncbi:hypothetical protein K7G98_00200 [Saccharothrix sp. MB29]|nr:hypothetical protein [Saccharothrix sp. MB29]
MERTRVGLVGVCTIARTHLAVLAERSDVDLLFTVDPVAAAPRPGPPTGPADRAGVAPARPVVIATRGLARRRCRAG